VVQSGLEKEDEKRIIETRTMRKVIRTRQNATNESSSEQSRWTKQGLERRQTERRQPVGGSEQ
jgi:hypothetical protein